jgi:hydrogenase/urease accessory protein HupE
MNLRCGVAVGAATLLLAAAPAAAHIRSTTGYSEVRQAGATVHYTLGIEYQPLAFAVGLGEKALDGTAPIRAEILRDRHAAVEAYVLDRLYVSVDGVQCEGALKDGTVAPRDGKDFATLALDYACPGNADGAFTIEYTILEEGGVVDDERNIVDYKLAGASGTYVFDSGHHELEAGNTGVFADVERFVSMGVHHILSGLDHLLFLFALLLGAGSLMSVVKLATAFTAAHSTTLALGALGWVHVPAEIVEPLIALSIFYVALENVLGGETRHRLAIVFAFGLLHGLGFASTLTFTDDMSPRLLGSLVSFNVGIELGQALLVAAVFPLLVLARRHRWSVPAHVAATSVAAALGLFWFAERMLAV